MTKRDNILEEFDDVWKKLGLYAALVIATGFLLLFSTGCGANYQACTYQTDPVPALVVGDSCPNGQVLVGIKYGTSPKEIYCTSLQIRCPLQPEK